MYTLSNLTKTYQHRDEPVYALDNISLRIDNGEFIAITGASGSGKTTLLLTLGGLIRPTSGQVRFSDSDLYSLSSTRLSHYRNSSVGFVLQTFNLVPYLTAAENVMVPMLLNGKSRNSRKDHAVSLLGSVGLSRRTNFLPRELSIGQQQRVAIARALANDPKVILADEPTGNLDPGLSVEIMDILKELNTIEGRTIIIVTHDPQAAERANRQLELDEGKLLTGLAR